MTIAKVVLLVTYALLAGVAGTRAGTDAGEIALWIIVALAVAHCIELLVFLPLARKAGGSLPRHMLQLLLFGVLYVRELKTAAATGASD